MEQTNIFDFNVEDKHYEYEKVFKKGQTIKLFEAFAGIGCQAMAFKRAGIPYETVGISEIDKYAIQSYNLIHDNVKNYGDITKMVEIPKCDVFTWSFPCTDLSKAGKQKGLNGTRSGLVYEVLRLLLVTKDKPKVLIMENVPDLVQEKFKSEFYEIQKEIESYGYKNFTQRLNAKHYGVAQNRDRVFMVSILGDYHYEFPTREKLKLRLKDYLEDSVDEKYYLSERQLEHIYITSFETKHFTQYARFNGHFESEARVWKDISPTITTKAQDIQIYDKNKIRNMTSRECWRLMGISDSDFDKVNGKVSNSQLYKQAGNGIVVDVFVKILKGLAE